MLPEGLEALPDEISPLGWSVLTWGHVMVPTFLPSASLLQSKFSLVKVTTSMLISELYTLWLFNIAMGNGPFIDGSPIKMVIFHGYVKQPDGSCQSSMISSGPVGFSHLYDLDASFSATDHPCYGLPGGKKSLGIYVVASDPIGCGCKEFFRAFAWSPHKFYNVFLEFW